MGGAVGATAGGPETRKAKGARAHTESAEKNVKAPRAARNVRHAPNKSKNKKSQHGTANATNGGANVGSSSTSSTLLTSTPLGAALAELDGLLRRIVRLEGRPSAPTEAARTARAAALAGLAQRAEGLVRSAHGLADPIAARLGGPPMKF